MGEAEVVNETDSPPVIQVDHFKKSYRKNMAVSDVELSVNRGEIYGLIGPDGAGKSSLLKAIAGVMTFDAGYVSVFGVHLDSEASAETVKSRIGFMPQGLGLNLYPDLTVDENIDFFAHLRLVSEQRLNERKQQLLAMTRLTPFRDRPMKKLSGGMKQKLGLICTLIHDPELLVLDEPTTGVDPVSRRDFWTILTSLLSDRQITALVTTAYLDEASRFHRVSLMYDGKVIAEGEPAQICDMVPGRIALLRTASQSEAITLLRREFGQVQPEGDRIRIFVDSVDADVAKRRVENALQGLTVNEIQIVDEELEDAFVELLRRQNPADPDTETSENSITSGSRKAGQTLSNNAAIEANALTKKFGDFKAADAVSFKVQEGEIFGLLGANGAGKTTVIKILTGIMSPSAGSGSVAGADLSLLKRAIKQRIGYMSQQFSLYTDLTVAENVMLYAGIYGLSKKEARKRCAWICDMAGLNEQVDERTRNLPVGMRQRLALGCALVHRPRVLFLDEPTSGIDPIGRQQFWRILFELSRVDGVTILVTTHYMGEAEHCDRLALMHAGRIVADAPPATLKLEVENEVGRVLEVDADDAICAVDRLVSKGFQEPAMFGRRIHVLSKSPEQDALRIPALLNGIHVSSVRIRELSMDDVFVHRIRALEQGADAAVRIAGT